jgi:hypothetical protein
MARKIKIPNHLKERFARIEINRNEDIRYKRRFYLIVCEGEKTEPHYFESLKENLPRGVLNVVDFKIIGTGNNTKSLVKKAKQLRKDMENDMNRKIDKLWVVFDRDSFNPQSFNSAIQECRNKTDIDCAWTNEAFELWYLLHFHYYNTGIGREQYQNLIERNFQSKGLRNYKYQKNSTEMFNLLEQYGNRENAVKNAEKLEKTYAGQEDFANQNPCTMVHKLVCELVDLEHKIK